MQGRRGSADARARAEAAVNDVRPERARVPPFAATTTIYPRASWTAPRRAAAARTTAARPSPTARAVAPTSPGRPVPRRPPRRTAARAPTGRRTPRASARKGLPSSRLRRTAPRTLERRAAGSPCARAIAGAGTPPHQRRIRVRIQILLFPGTCSPPASHGCLLALQVGASKVTRASSRPPFAHRRAAEGESPTGESGASIVASGLQSAHTCCQLPLSSAPHTPGLTAERRRPSGAALAAPHPSALRSQTLPRRCDIALLSFHRSLRIPAKANMRTPWR